MADLARWLGEGLALVADVFDPELMVIGGGVSESAPLFLDEAREHYAARADRRAATARSPGCASPSSARRRRWWARRELAREHALAGGGRRRRRPRRPTRGAAAVRDCAAVGVVGSSR